MNLLLIRLIIFAVLFFAGLKLYRMYREWKLDRDDPQQGDDQGNRMVRCSWCQVHLPEEDALRERGDWFCSSDHRDKYLAERKEEQKEEKQEENKQGENKQEKDD
ncbi:HTTM domain-containing protein [Halomonas sp. ATCH28]|uniref:HTTM domain-containing protein n=1 Tax=Halomonas gemina TaxID=2945105 RepID=A0ABT0T562_9GAMM|nr:PP0621 family protein [Halomonas gemina]MCL7942058.1 HTTM domain-containing protein [Halomonas gemina]